MIRSLEMFDKCCLRFLNRKNFSKGTLLLVFIIILLFVLVSIITQHIATPSNLFPLKDLSSHITSQESLSENSFEEYVQPQIPGDIARSKFERRLPRVIGIGNKKCSTGALLVYLCAHFKVVCSYHEAHFFDQSYDKGINYYKSLFPPSKEGRIGFEKTPRYFIGKAVPPRIQETYKAENQSVKFILSLCDPSLRAFSDYDHYLRAHAKIPGFEVPYHSFDDFLEQELNKVKEFLANDGLEKLENSNDEYYEDIIQGQWGRLLKGIYAFHLKRWYKVFPKSDFLIIDGDLLTTQPWVVMKEVQEYLNLPIAITREHFAINPATGFYCLSSKVRKQKVCLGNNKGRTRERARDGTISSKMSKPSERLLFNFYKSYDDELFKLTDKKFNWYAKDLS